jgi:F-type H+-transporting ATPase subunit alpha
LKRLERGKRISEILKQPQYKPYDEISEILSIFAVTSGLFDDVDVDKIMMVEHQMIDYVKKTYPDTIKKLSVNAKISDELKTELEKEINEFKSVNSYGSQSTTA